MAADGKPLLKFIAAAALLALGGVALGMTVCGAMFSLSVFDPAPYSQGIAVIAVPSLLFGLLLLWLVSKGLRRVLASKPPAR